MNKVMLVQYSVFFFHWITLVMDYRLKVHGVAVLCILPGDRLLYKLYDIESLGLTRF